MEPGKDTSSVPNDDFLPYEQSFSRAINMMLCFRGLWLGAVGIKRKNFYFGLRYTSKAYNRTDCLQLSYQEKGKFCNINPSPGFQIFHFHDFKPMVLLPSSMPISSKLNLFLFMRIACRFLPQMLRQYNQYR